MIKIKKKVLIFLACLYTLVLMITVFSASIAPGCKTIHGKLKNCLNCSFTYMMKI
jgi:hypothetical protein